MHRPSHREAHENPTYQHDTSDLIGQLPRASGTRGEQYYEGANHNYRQQYNAELEPIAGQSGWRHHFPQSSSQKRGPGAEGEEIEPDYDDEPKTTGKYFNGSKENEIRSPSKYAELEPIADQSGWRQDFPQSSSQTHGPDAEGEELEPDYDDEPKTTGKYLNGRKANEIRSPSRYSPERELVEPSATQIFEMKLTSRSESYPGRHHSGSARNRNLKNKENKRVKTTGDASKPQGWVNGLEDEIEQEANKDERKGKKKVENGHMTMKNAREIARAIGMELEAEDRRNREDGASVSSSNGSYVNSPFPHVSRKCWGRRCWSKSFHSHAQRFLQSDGKLTNLQTKLQQTPVSPATGFLAWELKHQKARKRIYENMKEIKNQAQFWSKSMKTIEGKFGTGVVSYFIFLRWLLYVNLLIFLSVLLLIVLPQACYFPESRNTSLPTLLPSLSSSLSSDILTPSSSPPWDEIKYAKCVKNKTDTQVLSRMQDFLQGTGWMERTLLFSGEYRDKFDSFCSLGEDYHLSLAYILVTLAYYFICLAMMVVYTTEGVRETMMTSEGHLTRYCNLVFGGWDYCIEGKANAQRKHDSIVQEVKSNLAEERRRAEVEQWSNVKKSVIYLTRLVVNVAILGCLTIAGYLIYYVCKYSLEMLEELKEQSKTDFQHFFNEFLPSLTITAFNIVLPVLFTQICKLENYSVAFEIKITLIRTVLLRLASVGVLIVTLYFQVNDDNNKRATCHCWETYVGQQMYKLVILDFIVTVVIVLLVELPRMLIVKHCQCKLAKLIGRQEFDIPKHVLDLVYSQTLCWIGTFYSPLLPAVCVLKYIFFFYLKKFTLLVNCTPSKIPYRASRSNTFFMIVLMLSFFLASVPLWYSVANVPPSNVCGPFRNYDTMWDPITRTVESWPPFLRETLNFLASVGFAVPVLIVLSLAIYYYSTVWAANKKMISVLRDQVVIEGTDKQFLLARLAEVAKRRHAAEDQM